MKSRPTIRRMQLALARMAGARSGPQRAHLLGRVMQQALALAAGASLVLATTLASPATAGEIRGHGHRAAARHPARAGSAGETAPIELPSQAGSGAALPARDTLPQRHAALTPTSTVGPAHAQAEGARPVLGPPPAPAATTTVAPARKLVVARASGPTVPVPVAMLQAAPDPAPLWDEFDPSLQRDLEREISSLGLARAAHEKRLGVALVDITDLDDPRVAAINGDDMVYAASLPKIAVLLASFERIATGTLTLDDETRKLLNAMIRVSSNAAASELMNRVGKPYIAYVLTAPKYRLYDERHGGGLWAGKNYASDGGLWQRDPIKNLSHAATPMQVARFYYMLAQGKLVNRQYNAEIRKILDRPGIPHKFVKGIARIDRSAHMFRKSGTWGDWHADSALIERAGMRYIAVGLCESRSGGLWLEKLIRRLDGLVVARSETRRAAAEEALTATRWRWLSKGLFGFAMR